MGLWFFGCREGLVCRKVRPFTETGLQRLAGGRLACNSSGFLDCYTGWIYVIKKAYISDRFKKIFDRFKKKVDFW